MCPGQDSGYNGQVRSLSNTQGLVGYGLRVTNLEYVQSAGYSGTLIPANGSRVWMLIRNGGTSLIRIVFGEDTTGSANCFFLNPSEILQIDSMLPWCGSIGVTSSAAVSVSVAEASQAGSNN